MKTKHLINFAIFLTFLITYTASAQSLYQMPEGIRTRWASPENPLAEKGEGAKVDHGRKGRPSVRLKAGDTLVMALEEPGVSGTVHRIWMTIYEKSPEMLMGLKLQMFWDGNSRPAVSAPLGYFFGMGLGKMFAFESDLFSSPEGRSFNCYIPMPFRDGMKILLINETGHVQESVFYDVDYTIGESHPGDVLYFHAWYKRQDSTVMREDYEFLPEINGKGRFLGVHFGVMANTDKYLKSWWGEGEVKIYLDGDTEFPTLAGTGTEDYIGTGWGQEQYDHMYQGSHYADHENMHYCFYRYHIPDPVYFYSDIRATIQQIGCCYRGMKEEFKARGTPIYRTGDTDEPEDYDEYEGWLFERSGDDWASCVYFYLDSPENGLPAIDPYDKRVTGYRETGE